LPSEEKFDLGSQIRRAAVSITANIAEGCGRFSLKEKIHFIGISYGSLMEVFSELQIAEDLGYIAKSELEQLRPNFNHISRMLSGLRNSYATTLNTPPSKP
jgi:four helix bundle protein